jgi:archaellum component FlaC
MSNDEKINDISTKKNIKILFLLIIIYFVYQNYNIFLLFILFIIFITFTIDLKKIIKDNNFLKIFNIFNFNQEKNKVDNLDESNELNEDIKNDFFKNYKSFKNTIYDYFRKDNEEHFTFKPYSENENKKDKQPDLVSKISIDLNKKNGIIGDEGKNYSSGSTENSINPFKEDVKKIKEMYENIKLEINRLNT